MAQETVTIFLNTQAQTGGIQATVTGLNGLRQGVEALNNRFAFLRTAVQSFLAPLAAAVSGGALVRFTKAAIDNADALAKQAQSAGMSLQAFSALSVAARMANVSQEQLIQSSRFLSEWLAKTGQSGRELSEALIEQADLFKGMADGADKVRLAQERFGRSGQQLIPLLNQGSEALREQMKEAEQFGAVIGPRFAANAQTFNDNLTRIATLFRGMFNALADALLPVFIKFQESVIEFVKSTDIHLAVVDSLIQVYQGFAIAIATVEHGFKNAGAAVGVFFGALAGGASFKQAVAATNAQLDQNITEFETRVDQILALSRRPDPGGAGRGGVESDSERLARLRNEFDLAVKRNNLELERAQNLRQAEQLDVGLSDGLRERMEAQLAYLQRELSILRERQQILSNFGIDGSANAILPAEEFLSQSNQVESAVIRLKAEIQAMQEAIADTTFLGRLSNGIKAMAEQVQHFGAEVANVLLVGLNRGIDTFANGIWAVVDGIATLGQLAHGVFRSMLSDLIALTVRAIFFRAIMSFLPGFGNFLGIPKLFGFAEGGIVPGGPRMILVNERGPEALLNAHATALLGENTINALNSSTTAAQAESAISRSSARSDSFAASVDQRPMQFTFLLLDKREPQMVLEALQSSQGKVMVLDLIKNNKIEAGIA